MDRFLAVVRSGKGRVHFRPFINSSLFPFSTSNLVGHHGDPKQRWHLAQRTAVWHVSPGGVVQSWGTPL